MNCPCCNSLVTWVELADGGKACVCERCGWGKQKLSEPQDGGRTAQGALNLGLWEWLKLALMWTLSLLIVFGPYFGLIWGHAWLYEHLDWTFLSDGDALRDKLNPGYWIALAAYIALADALTPTYDPENLGLFDSVLIDNPFSYEDDWNRMMLTLAVLLTPGKIVCMTLGATGRILKFVLWGGKSSPPPIV